MGRAASPVCASGGRRRRAWRTRPVSTSAPFPRSWRGPPAPPGAWGPGPFTDALPKRRLNGRRATAVPSRIRPAAPADVDDVAAIERAVFSDPWSRRDFAECVTTGIPFLVAEVDGLVGGYVVAHHAADEGEILNLGVAGAHRRHGLGRALGGEGPAALPARGVGGGDLEGGRANARAPALLQGARFRG